MVVGFLFTVVAVWRMRDSINYRVVSIDDTLLQPNNANPDYLPVCPHIHLFRKQAIVIIGKPTVAENAASLTAKLTMK